MYSLRISNMKKKDKVASVLFFSGSHDYIQARSKLFNGSIMSEAAPPR